MLGKRPRHRPPSSSSCFVPRRIIVGFDLQTDHTQKNPNEQSSNHEITHEFCNKHDICDRFAGKKSHELCHNNSVHKINPHDLPLYACESPRSVLEASSSLSNVLATRNSSRKPVCVSAASSALGGSLLSGKRDADINRAKCKEGEGEENDGDGDGDGDDDGEDQELEDNGLKLKEIGLKMSEVFCDPLIQPTFQGHPTTNVDLHLEEEDDESKSGMVSPMVQFICNHNVEIIIAKSISVENVGYGDGNRGGLISPTMQITYHNHNVEEDDDTPRGGLISAKSVNSEVSGPCHNTTSRSRGAIFSASSPPPPNHHVLEAYNGPASMEFLHQCCFCASPLQGKDIFMYRGDQAFCSTDCRYKQMVIDGGPTQRPAMQPK